MNVVSIRLAIDTVRTCLVHLQCEWRVVAARHLQQACDRVLRGDVDLDVASGTLPFWDVHVLEQITRGQGTELLFLHQRRWPEDLGRWLEGVRMRRDQHQRRAPCARPARTA